MFKAGSRDAEPRGGSAATPVLALTRRLVRRIFVELRGSRQQLTARHVEDVLHLATKSQSGSPTGPAPVVPERPFHRLLVFPVFPVERAAKIGRGQLADPPFRYPTASPAPSP